MRMRSLGSGLALAAWAAFPAGAAFPLETMGPSTLGIQYGFALRGADITSQDAPSHETVHAFSLGYAPLPYLALEGGLALDRYEVGPYRSMHFDGDFGISPLAGLALTAPPLFDILRLSGGIRALYLDSRDDHGYAYSGFISNPWLGLTVMPSPYFDLEAGARGHRIDGTIEAPGGSTRPFSNREQVRGYVSATLKSPSEFAFLTLDLDFSPAFDSDWSGGPREAAIGISCGTLLGGRPKAAPKAAPPYFPAYPDLKERQDKMAEEIR